MLSVTHLINQSDYQGARDVFSQINTDEPVAGESEWIEGRIAAASNQLLEAERWCVAGLQRNPSHYGIYYTLGNVLIDMERNESGRLCLIGSSFDDYLNQRYFAKEIASQALLESDVDAQPTILYQQDPVYFSDSLTRRTDVREEFKSPFVRANSAGVCVIEQGKVWFDGHNLCIYDKNNCLVDACTRGNPYLIESIRHQHQLQTLQGTLGVAIARSSTNYFHWTTDVMPGFHLMDCVAAQHGGIQRYLVSHQHAPFQLDFMSCAGVSVENVLTADLDTGCYFSAEKIIAPLFDHKLAMAMGQWAVDYLQSLGINTLAQRDMTSNNPERRIYISRRDVGLRNIENEHALVGQLRALGFDDVTLDGMSVAEQMQLFSECQVVVAPHGAGLTNTIYCAPGASVIEFFGDFVQPCFRALAHLSKLNYHQLSLTSADVDDMTKTRSKHANQRKSMELSNAQIQEIVSLVGQVTSTDALLRAPMAQLNTG